MASISIKITSDSVCPWCFVGLRRLQRAIAQFHERHPSPAPTFAISWHPFYLNPDAPSPSVSKAQSYVAKFGPDRTKQIIANLTLVGDEEGIKFSFLGKTGRTRDSHRLIAWAASQEAAKLADADAGGDDGSRALQTRVVEELFKSYFENEEDITQREVLEAAAGRAGLAGDAVTAFLKSDDLGPQVDAEAKTARDQEQINGVPNFVINDRFEVSGAQEPAAFLHLFERVLAVEEKAGTSSRMA